MRTVRTRTVALVVLAVAAMAPALDARAQWQVFRDPGFGYSIHYPSDIFVPRPSDDTGLHTFETEDEEATFVVGAWRTSPGQTPTRFRRALLAKEGMYDRLTYAPRGRSWFVLSGYRDDLIYYEKVMFTCRQRLATVFAITYPVAQRARFDRIVERMEPRFRPARACP